MALFDIKNLKKTYFNEGVDTKVLHGLTFDIEKGEFVSIMGPSGSGKSTLLHIVGFLDGYTGGEYRFNKKRYSKIIREK
jgi:putative ABC transport system ATP-binding protein